MASIHRSVHEGQAGCACLRSLCSLASDQGVKFEPVIIVIMLTEIIFGQRRQMAQRADDVMWIVLFDMKLLMPDPVGIAGAVVIVTNAILVADAGLLMTHRSNLAHRVIIYDTRVRTVRGFLLVTMKLLVTDAVGITCTVVIMPNAVLMAGAGLLMTHRGAVRRRNVRLSGLATFRVILIEVKFLMPHTILVAGAVMCVANTILMPGAGFLMAYRICGPAGTIICRDAFDLFTHFDNLYQIDNEPPAHDPSGMTCAGGQMSGNPRALTAQRSNKPA